MRISRVAICALIFVAACADRPRNRIDSDPSRDEPSVGRSTEYEIRSGDDWTRISETFFGDGRNANRIAADNGFDPAEPPAVGDRIEVRVLTAELELVRRVAEARGPYNAGVEWMQERGKDDEAREAFERALDRAPHFLDARYNLGLVLIRLGEPDAAARHLRDVVKQRPDDPDAHYGLAAAYVYAGDDRGAIPSLERALELDPEFLRARWTYALALQRSGRTREAVEAWRRYLQRDATSALADEARTHLRELGS